MKKGFTLIELLTVIIIISILVTMSSIAVSKLVKKSKSSISKLQEESIIDSARMLSMDDIVYLPSENKCKYITIDELFEYGYIDSKIIDPKKSKEYSDIYISVCAINNGAESENAYNYELKYLDENGKVESGMNPFFLAEPDLYDGDLTPIVYVKLTYENSAHTGTPEREVLNGTEVITSTSDNEVYEWQVPYEDDIWYDYPNQMWANAVVLDNNVEKNPGDTVNVDLTVGSSDAIGMFVWIPRYSYTLKCQNSDLTSCYGNYDYVEKYNASSNVGTSTRGAIDVKFVSTNVKDRGNAKFYDGKPQEWYTMPAFTLIGDNNSMELDGIWIGKFQTNAYDVSNNEVVSRNFACDEGCSESSMIRTLPNIKMLLSNDIYSYYNLIKGVSDNYYLSNSDTHMVKDSEFAAAANLSQSIYGKYGNMKYSGEYKNVYKNILSSFKTGYSNGGSSSCINDDVVSITRANETYDSCLTQFKYDYLIDLSDGRGSLGAGASTTGNIYGIYDMVGAAFEYVMFNADNSPGDTDFTRDILANLSKKHVDKYSISDKTCNGESCLGYGFDTYYQHIGFTQTSSFMVRGGYNNLIFITVFNMGVAKGSGGSRDTARIAIFKEM